MDDDFQHIPLIDRDVFVAVSCADLVFKGNSISGQQDVFSGNVQSVIAISLYNRDSAAQTIIAAATCKHCRNLNLYQTSLHPPQVRLLASSLPRLQRLQMRECSISQADIAALLSLCDLKYFSLSNMPVDDNIIPYIARCKSLRTLELANTNITFSGLEQLKRERTDLVIFSFRPETMTRNASRPGE